MNIFSPVEAIKESTSNDTVTLDRFVKNGHNLIVEALNNLTSINKNYIDAKKFYYKSILESDGELDDINDKFEMYYSKLSNSINDIIEGIEDSFNDMGEDCENFGYDKEAIDEAMDNLRSELNRSIDAYIVPLYHIDNSMTDNDYNNYDILNKYYNDTLVDYQDMIETFRANLLGDLQGVDINTYSDEIDDYNFIEKCSYAIEDDKYEDDEDEDDDDYDEDDDDYDEIDESCDIMSINSVDCIISYINKIRDDYTLSDYIGNKFPKLLKSNPSERTTNMLYKLIDKYNNYVYAILEISYKYIATVLEKNKSDKPVKKCCSDGSFIIIMKF